MSDEQVDTTEVTKPNGATAAEIIGAELSARLDQGDFDLFIPALRNAHATAQRFQQGQLELNQLDANRIAAQGALHYVMRHLAPKYQMAEGDDIDADGVIIRKNK